MKTEKIPFALLAVIALLVCTGGCDLGTRRGEMNHPPADPDVVNVLRTSFTSAESGTGGEGVTADLGEGWSTLRGRFVYDGTPPQRNPRTGINKELDICAPGGRFPLDNTLVVDPDTNGIANMVIFLRKAPRVHESALVKRAGLIFDQKQCVFTSHVFASMAGEEVEIKNSDATGHNANITGGSSQLISGNSSISYALPKANSFPADVTCNVHPWMKAYWLARDNLYMAVSGEDGTFEIPNLPAGVVLEFQAWHERGTGTKGMFKWDSAPGELKWSKKGRFKVTLVADEPQNLDLSVPGSAFN